MSVNKVQYGSGNNFFLSLSQCYGRCMFFFFSFFYTYVFPHLSPLIPLVLYSVCRGTADDRPAPPQRQHALPLSSSPLISGILTDSSRSLNALIPLKDGRSALGASKAEACRFLARVHQQSFFFLLTVTSSLFGRLK